MITAARTLLKSWNRSQRADRGRTLFPIIIFLLVISSFHSLSAQPSDLQGQWVGNWEREGQTVPITMHFVQSADGFRGTFDSDVLRVVGIPMQEIRFNAPKVTWKIVGDFTTNTFEGELRGDELKGTYQEGDATGHFSFRRSNISSDTISEELFHFESGDLKLSGTLLLPGGTGRSAAVVFLHGSGAEGRWASKYLATRFAKSGVAALIYDKRGVGESKGDWRTASFSDLSDDTVAAVTALRKHPRIDPALIGLHGHSQGGTIVPLVASRISGLAFVIGSAGAGLPMDEVEIYSLENSMDIKSLPADEADLARRFARALVNSAYHGAPKEPLLEIAEKVKGKPWAFEIPAADHSYWAISRKIAEFDPIPYWKKVDAPVFLCYGELDARVPPRQSASNIVNALLASGGNNVSVRIYSQADHTFRIANRGAKGFSWPKTADGYPDEMIDWVKRVISRP